MASFAEAAASTDLVSHLGGVTKNILVISGYLNFPIEAIKAEQPQVVDVACREGVMGCLDALVTVRRSEDLDIHLAGRHSNRFPDILHDGVVQSVFDLIDQDHAAWGMDNREQNGQKQPYHFAHQRNRDEPAEANVAVNYGLLAQHRKG